MRRSCKEFFIDLWEALTHIKRTFHNIWLCHRYPFLVPRNRWTGKVSHSCYVRTELDCMPSGWRDAFGEQMCEEIRNALLKHKGLLKKYRISQIKEKYGVLRWYDFGTTREVQKIITKYELLSMCYCQFCGKPVRYRTLGWISYLCKDCALNKDLGLNVARLTEEDVPSISTVDCDGNVTEKDCEIDFRALWGLDDGKSYYLPKATNMYDKSYCTAKCEQECARKMLPDGIYTTMDLSSVCSDFLENWEDEED